MTTETTVASFYATHQRLCAARKDPLSIPYENRKREVYGRYSIYYDTSSVVDYIRELIIRAISVGETSCIVFDENTVDTRLNADELVAIFEEGVDERPSIQALFNTRLGTSEFSMTRHRFARSKINGEIPTVTVQYVLRWELPSLI